MTDQTPDARPGWARMHLWQIQWVRDVLVVLGVVGVLLLGQKVSVVTVPLLLAVLLAYLFEPVIRLLVERTPLRRRGAAAAIIVAALVLVVLPTVIGAGYGAAQLIGFVGRTADNTGLLYESVNAPGDDALREQIAENCGSAWVWMRDRLVAASAEYDMQDLLGRASAWLQNNAKSLLMPTAQAGAGVVRSTLGLLGGVFGLGFMLFVTGFFFFFVSTGWPRLNVFGARMLPEKHRTRTIELLGRFDEVISGFVRGRLTIAFVQAVFFSLAYWVIGVPAAFVLGPAVAVLSIVPYLALVGIPISIVLLLLENHTGIRGTWWWALAAPAVVYFIGQALDDYVLTPMIQGKSTGMDTPTILFASLAGGALFGIFGLLIAIPIAACVKILLQEVFWPRFKAWAEGKRGDPLPIE